MEIIRGKITGAYKVVIYGPEGIGKSTFASRFPDVLFIDTEGSTKHMDVARLPRPTSWAMLLEEVRYVLRTPGLCRTLAIDTADWAEMLCSESVCAKSQKNGIEDFSYGKGYVYLAEEFGRLLNLLDEIVEQGIHVVVTAHARMRKFEQPDEMGAYDRWEMKLQKNTCPLLKEWADMVLFANYKTYVVQSEEKKNKAQGGRRVLYTTHHCCWDAKNRFGLPDELPLDFDAIAHLFGASSTSSRAPAPEALVPSSAEESRQSVPKPLDSTAETRQNDTNPVSSLQEDPPDAVSPDDDGIPDGIPRALRDLMRENEVSEEDIRFAVASRGYYPSNTPIANYDPDFIDGVLIDAWPQVLEMIRKSQNVPF